MCTNSGAGISPWEEETHGSHSKKLWFEGLSLSVRPTWAVCRHKLLTKSCRTSIGFVYYNGTKKFLTLVGAFISFESFDSVWTCSLKCVEWRKGERKKLAIPHGWKKRKGQERKGSRVSKLFTFLSFGSNQLKVNMDFIFCFPFFISGVLSRRTHTSEKRKPTPKEVRLQTRRFWVGTILNLDPGPFLKNNSGVDAEPILLGPDPVPIGKLIVGSRTGFT